MKLVSFDIGLRNLSVCVMTGTSRSNVSIQYWDVIDVMAEGAGLEKLLCHKCKKPANWTNGTLYSCTRHCQKTKCTKTSLQKKTIEVLKQEASSQNLEGTTKKELVDNLYKHYSSTAWKRCVKSSRQGSVVDLAPAIAKSLESRRDIWRNADWVIFEQQPDKRMMAVQAMMHMWFVCQGFNCKGVSAVHKLTNMVTLEDKTKTYAGRKKTGIIHATALIPTESWKAFMLSHSKKDDLCDAFLQSIWFLENMR